MMTSSNTNISLMTMYEDESVDVRYVDDSRLHLSPCGSEFVLEKAPACSAHPLQSSEKVRQRTRFATSSYKDLMLGALEFRNEYATQPYLPEELIPDDHRKQVFSIDPEGEWPACYSCTAEVEWPACYSCTAEVEWPACYSCTAEVGLNRKIIVSSVERRASLLLSPSGEEFSVNFTCRLSHNQHHRPRSREPNRSVTEHAQQDNQTCRSKTPSQQSNACAEQQQGEVYLSTRVVQHHSVSCVPLVWRYPLSLALHLWRAQSQPSGENRGDTEEETARGRDQTERAVTMTNTSRGERRSHLPQALPLRCPSPHQHRWKFRYSLVQDEQEADQDLPTELVKVVWCQGVLYRIVDGAIPVVEVSPGDGSVIRSNGELASYFTHHRAGPGPGEVKDVTYHLSSLPPDTPGQVYSVCSMVTRATRILNCYNQARHSLKLSATQSCLNKETSSEPFVQEVHISESGYINTTETRQSRPNCVAEELEKIKRFNFMLENSHLLRAQRGSTVVGCGSKEQVAHCEPVSESIAEALQRTSKAIQDIDNLLSATILSRDTVVQGSG
uniref:Zgc:153352 n=1 Tax=Hucho hucho TaxID=62062 RepID=A0A4W5KWE9_9TELE